jgi:glycosyltransferase involved in cell wall biosynthesis
MVLSLRASIVICTYNRCELLVDAVTSVCKQSMKRGDYEIIIVDNSADPGSVSENKKRVGRKVDQYLTSSPPGLSLARNVGAAAARTDILLYLDDDAIADRHWVEEMVRPFENARTDCVGGRVIPFFEGECPAWLSIDLYAYISALDYGDHMIPVGVGKYVVGASVAFRRAALDRCGGFPVSLGRIGNTNSLLSNDETAVLDAIREADRQIVYNGAAVVRHFVPASRLTKEWFRRRVIWQAISDVLKGEKSTSAELEQFKERYRTLAGAGLLSGRSIFGLLSVDAAQELYPDSFLDEVGLLYAATRYLIESGSNI